MRIAFKTKTLPHISIKTNGNIKKSIDAYRKSQVPLSRLLTSFLAIKTIPEKLSEVDNPYIKLEQKFCDRFIASALRRAPSFHSRVRG